MKRTAVARLIDIREMIDAVAEMIEGVDFGTYRTDLKLRLAVERCVEIISEASRHISEADKTAFPEVPWPEIAAIGNKLRHEYNRVDDLIVWQVAAKALPGLRPVIISLLTRNDHGER